MICYDIFIRLRFIFCHMIIVVDEKDKYCNMLYNKLSSFLNVLKFVNIYHSKGRGAIFN